MENSLLLSGTSKESKASPRGQRNNAWHDVLEICKKGFANKMSSMSDEILQEVRLEVDQSAISLRKDVADMLERREQTSNQKLEELDSKMEAVVGWAKAGYVDFSKIDFTPLLDEMRFNETLHSESTRQLSQRFDESFVLLSSALDKLAVKADDGDEKIRALTARVEKSEEKLSEVSEMVGRSQREISEKLSDVLHEGAHSAETLASRFDSTLEPVAGSTKAIKDDLRQIFDRLGSDTNAVLNEIGKIQQAMNLDFVRTDGDDTWGMGQSAAVSVPMSILTGRNQSDKHAPKRVRVREFFSQTDEVEQQEKMTQTDPKMQTVVQKKEKIFEKRGSKKMVKLETKNKNEGKLAASRTRGFNDPDQLKQKARQALIKPPYNVFDYYHEEGLFQQIARSIIFDYLSLTMVCLNAIWIAIDADLNDAAVITSSPPIFIVVENLFCTYFFAEVFIRFMAFAEKYRALRDRWFVFDSCLVFFMVLETWVTPIIVLGFNIDLANSLDLSTLRMFRMVKLLRLSRMAKLMHAVPELTIILKGIKLALRSVLVFFSILGDGGLCFRSDPAPANGRRQRWFAILQQCSTLGEQSSTVRYHSRSAGPGGCRHDGRCMDVAIDCVLFLLCIDHYHVHACWSSS